MAQSNAQPRQKNESYEDAGADYERAMSALGIGAALWDSKRGIEIGDVGYLDGGRFRRLFNVTMPPNQDPNPGVLPQDYEMICCEDQKKKTIIKPVIKMTRNVSLESPTLSQFAAEPAPLKFPRAFRFVASRGQGAILLTFEDAVVREVEPSAEFETHFTEHFTEWIRIARTRLGEQLRAEELILVRGYTVICSRWVAATFNGSGPFTLEVDEWNNVTATSDKGFTVYVCSGSVAEEQADRSIHESCVAEGRTSEAYSEERDCLLLKYYTMKKKMWGPPKVVLAA